MNDSAWSCATCANTVGTKRYCAPGRCYCGHPDCHAYDTWVDLATVKLSDDSPVAAPSRTWDTREESTWIDKL